MTLETVEQIVALLREYPVSEIALEQNGQRVCARRLLGTALASAQVAPDEAIIEPSVLAELSTPEAPEPIILTATMVGLFRQARPQVGYGTQVSPGQVIGSIESMKVMNDVPATVGGRVVDVFVEEGAPVEYGQALFRLAPPEE